MLLRAILHLSVLADIGLAAAFVAGGMVKGALGVGVPLLLVPLSSQFIGLPAAVALISVPTVSANLSQALEGGGTLPAVRRLWPMMVTLALGTVIGVHLLVTIDRRVLDAAMGTVFVTIAVVLLRLPSFRTPPRIDRWAAPVVELGAGVLGGMSAIFGPPLLAYLIGRGDAPEVFVKQVAMLMLIASTSLVVVLGGSGAMSPADYAVSLAAVIPIQLGLPIGRRLRGKLPPLLFRAIILCVLAGGGLQMLYHAIL